MKIDRRIVKNFDWITLTIILILSVAGILTIYSATRSPITNEIPGFYTKQIYWLVISLIALVAVTGFDYNWLRRFSYPLYGIGVFLLLIVLIIGKTGMGAQRWLNLGFLSFQPSEVFKVFLVLALSRYLEEINTQLDIMELLKILFTLALLPFLLIFKQPDLGTSAIVLMVFFALVAIKGLEKKAATLIIIIGIISIPFLGNIMWENLKAYQKNRIVAFMEPEVDPSGIGYHINQSKIAIGSGKLFGKGYLKGTQGPFRFLPEKHTDFIYAVLAEEWGFIGSFLILLLYFALILRGLDTARKAKDEFGRLVAIGITTIFGIHFFVNIGMTMGIMPVVGIPLPFMSYGGTALLTNFIAAGILINVRARRFEIFY